MPDYNCWCIWDMDVPKNINPDTLPISSVLKKRLHEWESTFDETLDLGDHTKIGFDSEQEYIDFCNLGWNLLDDLRSEMPDFEWWYRDMRYPNLLREMPKKV